MAAKRDEVHNEGVRTLACALLKHRVELFYDHFFRLAIFVDCVLAVVPLEGHLKILVEPLRFLATKFQIADDYNFSIIVVIEADMERLTQIRNDSCLGFFFIVVAVVFA